MDLHECITRAERKLFGEYVILQKPKNGFTLQIYIQTSPYTTIDDHTIRMVHGIENTIHVDDTNNDEHTPSDKLNRTKTNSK